MIRPGGGAGPQGRKQHMKKAVAIGIGILCLSGMTSPGFAQSVGTSGLVM